MSHIGIGTGQLGLVSGLKDLDELIDQSDPQRDAYAVLKPIQEIPAADWALDTGDAYVANFSMTFKDILRDIVGVKTLIDPAGLTRVETLALCRSTPGTFFFDLTEEFSGVLGTWDDGSAVWQIATWAFDGTSYLQKSTALDGISDGKSGTISCWFKSNTTGEQKILNCANNSITLQVNSDGVVRVIGRNSAGTIILDMESLVSVGGDGTWHHVVASWDLATTSGDLYLDSSDNLDISSLVLTNDTIDYTQVDYTIGANSSGGDLFTGELGQLWLDTVAVDLTDPAVLAKFIVDATGKPTDLEQDGSGPHGVSPIIFMHSTVDDRLLNSGTGGDFDTEANTVTVGLTTPVNPTGAMLWDQFTKLYIHQSDGSNPANTTSVAVFAFYFANKGTFQPSLGDDKLSNGSFEDNEFDNTTSPTSWTKLVSADPTNQPTLTRGTSDPKSGDQYPVYTFPGEPAESNISLRQSIPNPVDGAYYRVSGWHYSTTGIITALGVINSALTDNYVSNGRDLLGSAASLMSLDETGGEWKRFIFDFRYTASLVSPMVILFAQSDTVAGTVRFDGIKVQRIWRYNFYEPRLTSTSLPPVETSSNDIFFGGKAIGSGSVSIVNSDGLMDELVAELEWMNQECLIDIGGTFLDSAGTTQEVDTGDQFRQMTGLIQDIDITDSLAKFDLQDKRIFFHQLLPKRIYDDEIHPSMDLTLQGKVRPIWFGVKNNITPSRINVNANSYGVYELTDTLLSPNGIKQISKVYAYADSDAAATKDSTQRLQLTTSTDYSEDLANGQFTIVRDVGPYVIDPSNQFLDFNEGGSEITSTITAGLYTAADLAAEIQTQLLSDGAAADWTCTYSESTHKFTIAKAAGTGNLLAKTGSNREAGPWKLIGIKTNADYSVGSGSKVADGAAFESADKNHILRVDGIGYKDDASGTYTGTANASIEIGADVLRVLLLRWLDKPTSIIDESSFLFARARAPESLSLYLNTSFNTRDLFDRMEFSNIANIIIDGSGQVFLKVYVGTIPDNIKLLNDSDFQRFSSGRATNEVFQTVKVQFDQDPTTGLFEVRETTDPSVSVRLGRPEAKEVPTFLKIGDNALSVSARMLELASTAPRKLTGVVLGSKMLRLEVGDKFKITRRRALAKGGQIRDEVFRIISIAKSALTGKVSFTATDDRITVASQACITTCQQFCESTCQLTCQQSCQETCEVSCQVSCEVACQEACQLGCQATCQLGCQTTCEVNCQETCQLSCQGACEGGGCQTNCEVTCQTTCELTCQDACQSACQTVCQTTECQGTCQQSCQETCEATCQTICQTSCQTTCETNCQDLCETSCQSACQGTCQTVVETGDL